MADPNQLPPLPKNHLDHPENWATGGDPATDKQKGFVAVLEKQHPDLIPEGGLDKATMGKSEASATIDKLRNGQSVDEGGTTEKPSSTEEPAPAQNNAQPTLVAAEAGVTTSQQPSPVEDDTEKAGTKRKAPSTTKGTAKEPIDFAEDDDTPTGKDLKKSKQSTLDGAMLTTSGGPPNGEASGRTSKKAKKEDLGLSDGQDEPTDDVEAIMSQAQSVEDPIPRPSNPTPNHASAFEDPAANPGAIVSGGGAGDGTLPGDDAHLDHPENWTTGDEPATDKQKGFIKLLEKKNNLEGTAGDVDSLGKSEASAKIDEMKNL